MTADSSSRGRPSASPDDSASPRSATVPERLADQIDRVARDIAAARRLAEAEDPLARGAALAAAHGALALATVPLASQMERELRREALDDAKPALTRAGLGHVVALVDAALALELHPVALERARGMIQ